MITLQRRNIFLLGYLFAALLLCTGTARGQAMMVRISPASIDTKVKAGATYTQTFTITNGTAQRYRFTCSASDLWYDENNKRISGRPGTLPRSASQWVQYSPAEIVIEPNSSATVKAVLTIPPGISGSYFTAPTFEGVPVGKPPPVGKITKATADIGIRFLALMMLTSEVGADYNMEIMGGKVTPPSKFSELEVNLDLRNRGTAHARMRGAFAILNSSGGMAGRGTIEEKRYLPTQRTDIKGTWAGELPPGNYTCIVTLSYNRFGSEPASLVYELPFTVK